MFKRKRNYSTPIISILLVIALLSLNIPVFAADSSSSSQILSDRLAGQNRYETSVEITKSGWTTSDYAIIASGENFPDALCGAPLAKKYNAPILLTAKDSLDEQTKNQLTRLKVKNVFIIGGVGVISASVEQELISMGITVTRIAGSDRYETSLKVTQTLGQFTQAVIATGENFPDALSIAPIAAMKGIPILLTPKDNLPEGLKEYLNNNVQSTYVVGGSGVVSDNVLNQLTSPKRLSGASRYETNTSIIREFTNDVDFGNCYLATGENFPDALAGSALASLTKSPVILVSNPVDQSTKDLIISKFSNINKVIAFGGTGVVPESILISIQCNFANTGAAAIGNNIKVFDKPSQNAVWDNISNITYTDEGTQFTLNDKQSELSNLNTGDIYYMEPSDNNPLGYAGKVVEIKNNSSGQKVLTVVQPTLNELFSEMNFDTKKQLTPEDLVSTNLQEGTTIEFVNSNDTSMKIQSFNTTAVSSPDLKIKVGKTFDLDGNPQTDYDQIKLNLESVLKKPTIDVGIDFNKLAYVNWPYGIKYAKAQITTTKEDSFGVNVKLKEGDIAGAIKKLIGQSENQISVGNGIKIKGVDMGDKIILGNATFALGSIPVSVKPGEPLKTIPLGAALLLTITLDGEIAVTAELNTATSTFFDTGFVFDNGKVSFNSQAASEAPTTTLTVGGDIKFKAGAGLGLAVITSGIIPVDVNGDLVFDTSVKGEGKVTNFKDFSGELGGEASLKLKSDFAYGLTIKLKNETLGEEATLKLAEKILDGPVKFGISFGPADTDLGKPEYGNTEGNIIKGGYVAQKGDWVYYSNFADGFKLYRMHSDGTGSQKLSDYAVCMIIVDGEWIYYSANDGTVLRKICKIHLDGTQEQIIYKAYGVSDLHVGNNMVYFQVPIGGIKRINTDGSQEVSISQSWVETMVINGDWIYYTSPIQGFVYKISIDGAQYQALSKSDWNSDKCCFINVADNWIYYSNGNDNNKIYRMRTDGSEIEKICDDNSSCLNVSGDWIYYSIRNDYNKVYRIRKDGSGREKLSEESAFWINVVGDWVYYGRNEGLFNNYMYRMHLDGSMNSEMNRSNDDETIDNIIDEIQ